MPVCQIVIDTNVWIASLRSKRGASYRLFSYIDSGLFQVNVSVPLILEYEATAKRLVGEILLTENEVDDILNYVCQVANQRRIYYLWRPFLGDPDDEMVLELAVSAGCDFIVTSDRNDFCGIEQFGMQAITPQEFLNRIGPLP